MYNTVYIIGTTTTVCILHNINKDKNYEEQFKYKFERY